MDWQQNTHMTKDVDGDKCASENQAHYRCFCIEFVGCMGRQCQQ